GRVGNPLDVVEPFDRLLERRGAEDDGDRVRLVLFVQQPQLVAELLLCGGKGRQRGLVLAASGRLLVPERGQASVEPRELGPRQLEPAAERVELEGGRA